MIKIFTRSSCGPCQTLKYWLKQKKIAYEEVDISASPYAMAPTIEVNGQVISGLNIPLLVRLIGANN